MDDDNEFGKTTKESNEWRHSGERDGVGSDHAKWAVREDRLRGSAAQSSAPVYENRSESLLHVSARPSSMRKAAAHNKSAAVLASNSPLKVHAQG